MVEITVFGGTGFLGRRIVETLAAQGHAVRIGTRRPGGEAARRVADGAAPAAGALRPVKADVLDPASVRAAVAGADAAVNAVGHWLEKGAASFEAVHVEGARRVAEAASEAGVARLVHLSGIGSDPEASSPYVRSRGRGEVAVREAFPAATIFRPSAMFAAQEGLVAALESLVRRAPVIPLFGRGLTRLQPVHADDVAMAAARALDQNWTAGRVLELGGPDIVTYRELVAQVMRAGGRRRLLLPVPFAVWKMLASALSPLPSPPLTEGQVALMGADNVASPDAPGLADLGIAPRSLAQALSSRGG
jgi:uncharacterized protein YbjT (DUF2867 family)